MARSKQAVLSSSYAHALTFALHRDYGCRLRKIMQWKRWRERLLGAAEAFVGNRLGH